MRNRLALMAVLLASCGGGGGSDGGGGSGSPPEPLNTSRSSVDSSGAQAAGSSSTPAVSADGRYVVFTSGASNLVPNDTNIFTDVFLRDHLTGATTLLSVNSAGVQGTDASSGATISGDGRTVAFTSVATNLVAGDTNTSDDIFVRDTWTNTTTRVSVTSLGDQVNGSSGWASTSADGRYVAFMSNSSNLVPGDTNSASDVFVHDRQTATTERASVDTAEAQIVGNSHTPAISGDGRYLAFESTGTLIVPGDTNGATDLFLRDRLLGTTVRVSLTTEGNEANADHSPHRLSSDGRFVVWQSSATDLVPGDTNGASDAFRRGPLF